MKKAANLPALLLLLYSVSNVVIADGFYLSSLQGSTVHRSSTVWTGHFTAADGRKFDTSNFYKAQNFLLSAKGVAAIDITPTSSIVLPFTLDAGYHSELYIAEPLLSLGVGYVATTSSWQFSLITNELLAFGGKVSESPCVDSFAREFHCGTGLPWVDYGVVQPARKPSVTLTVKNLF